MTQDLDVVIDQLRATYARGDSRSLSWRATQLDALDDMLDGHATELEAALAADLGKSRFEAFATEISIIRGEIATARKKMKKWAKPRRIQLGVTSLPASARIVPEPLGVVLVFAPWNYPVMLALAPVVAALSAGNTVLLKPSEVTPTVSALLRELIDEHLDAGAVRVIEGGPDVAEALLDHRFDHIFYTGNGRVGRIVMAAAAKHLTPVTLELGGKSPTIVDASADVAVAAKRIAWGKGLNGGQSCVAPDYVLAHWSVKDELVEALRAAFEEMHVTDGEPAGDLTAVVNDRHLERVRALAESAGVELDVSSERRIAPVVVEDPDRSSLVMSEEIFAPILPVLAFDRLAEAIDFVNVRDKPLALYVFADDDDVVDRIVEETSSGGVCVNHTMFQFAAGELPFGGVGESGFGAYHGRYGFDQLSHLKPVLRRPTKPDLSFIYPPYTAKKEQLLRRILR